jgi:hypothetical protein
MDVGRVSLHTSAIVEELNILEFLSVGALVLLPFLRKREKKY